MDTNKITNGKIDEAKIKERVEDLEKRFKAFNPELIQLLKKYDVGLGAVPVINGTEIKPSETFNAMPRIFDAKKYDETELAEA